MADKKKAGQAGSLHAAAVKLGGAGGTKGGPARAAQLSPARRSAIAKMGGEARAKKAK